MTAFFRQMTSATSTPLSRDAKKRLLFYIVVAGFISSFIYHFLKNRHGHPYPWNTFLFLPEDRFMDFFNLVIAFKEFAFNTNIFPSQNIFFAILSPFPDPIALTLFLGVFVAYFIWLVCRYFRVGSKITVKDSLMSITIGCLSYPFLFVVDRANIESYMFILVSLFAILYASGRKHCASIALGLAIGAKVFPAVFVIFYLRDRAIKPLFTLAAVLGILAATFLIPENPRLTLDRMNWFISLYMNHYVIGDAGLGFSHSFFGLLKIIIYHFTEHLGSTPTEWYVAHAPKILKIYSPLTFVVYGFAALIILLRKHMEYWKQLAILTTLFCLLPHVSGDYKLMHLFTPLIFFFSEDRSGRYSRVYCVLFGLLLIPKAYSPVFYGASIGVILNPLLLISLLGLIIYEEWKLFSVSTDNRKVRIEMTETH